MILHIPHSSVKMLPDIKVSNLKENLNLYTDWYTDDLFFHEAAEKIVFPYSRFSVDVERLPNDFMELYGLGILYTKDVFGNKIHRKFDQDIYFYDKHHNYLSERTNFYTGFFKKVIIIDCHSFNDNPLYFEDEIMERPDFCIGINKESCLSNDLYDYFKRKGYIVDINFPYVGSIIPRGFENSYDIESVMIEVNKKLYLNDDYEKNDKYIHIKNIIKGALDIAYEYNR
jgi:N-formylglutamate deformylase